MYFCFLRSSADLLCRACAALGALVNAGADVRAIQVYPIHHGKAIIAGWQAVELGSFNYCDAAAHKNNENVCVNWSDRLPAWLLSEPHDRRGRLPGCRRRALTFWFG